MICNAQPYGAGLYNANIPYGDETKLTISTNGDITIPITPTLGGTLATGTSTVTVATTDVKGYKLYIAAKDGITYMDNLGAHLPASANSFGSGLPLANNTWGYNTDASSNFAGILPGGVGSDQLVKSVTYPVKSGDVTTFTYGLKLDFEKPAGKYVAYIVYTAVPQTN